MSESSQMIESIRRSSRGIVRHLGFLQEEFTGSGVSHSECHVLIELARMGPRSASELSVILNLDPSTLSRVVSSLSKKGWVLTEHDSKDKRRRILRLSDSGKSQVDAVDRLADEIVAEALVTLSATEQEAVIQGLKLYSRALSRVRSQRDFTVRPIAKSDDPQVAQVIRQVMPEFGCDGPGYALHDPEVSQMSTAYGDDSSRYYVLLDDNERVVGGAGFAQLEGGEQGTCELRKMYLLPEARGFGLGDRLLRQCLQEAQMAGYGYCYLETTSRMLQAQALYRKHGFEPLEAPLGDTGHHGCDAWFGRNL